MDDHDRFVVAIAGMFASRLVIGPNPGEPPPPIWVRSHGRLMHGRLMPGLHDGAAVAAAEPADDGVLFRAAGFHGSATLLEESVQHDRPTPIERLVVCSMRGAAQGERMDDISFPRFVALLGQGRIQDGGGGRAVQRISFMVDWNRLPSDDVERLFRDVLPAHPTLQSITFDVSRLPARYLRLLAEALPTEQGESTLSKLCFIRGHGNGPLDPVSVQGNVQAVVDMLGRNAALATLAIDVRLDAGQCRLLCQAVARNTNLLTLSIRTAEVRVDTLDGVAASSSLRQLQVNGSFSDDAVSSLAMQLRTNVTLEALQLEKYISGNNSRHRPDVYPILQLVKTYNCTLRTIEGSVVPRINNAMMRGQFDRYLNRNNRIRSTLQVLKDSKPDVPNHLLPILLGLLSVQPTPLFRILRTGYGIKISGLVLLAKRNGSALSTTSPTVPSSIEGTDSSPPTAKRRRVLVLGQNDDEEDPSIPPAM